MHVEQIHEAAVKHGIAAQALDQVVAQVQAHFTGATPRPADIEAYIGGLPTWEKAGIAYPVFEKLHPNARRQLHETHHPTSLPPVHSRRPLLDYTPTPEQQTELEALTNIHERTTRYRQMRDEAAQRQP